MSSLSVNGKGWPKATIQATQGEPSVPPPMISLPVGGRNGLQPHTEGKFVWKVELGAKKNYGRLGERLARCDDLYRNRSNGLGLIQVLPNGKTRLINRASELAPVLADRISMVVTKDGKVTSEMPQAATSMLCQGRRSSSLASEPWMMWSGRPTTSTTSPWCSPDITTGVRESGSCMSEQYPRSATAWRPSRLFWT